MCVYHGADGQIRDSTFERGFLSLVHISVAWIAHRVSRRYTAAQHPTVLQLLALQGLISIQRVCSAAPHRALEELLAAIGQPHLKGLFADLDDDFTAAFPPYRASSPRPLHRHETLCHNGRIWGEYGGRGCPNNDSGAPAAPVATPNSTPDNVLEALSEV